MAVPRAMGSLLVFNPNDYGLAVRGSTDLYTGIYDQQELNRCLSLARAGHRRLGVERLERGVHLHAG